MCTMESETSDPNYNELTLSELRIKRGVFLRQITEFEKYLTQIENVSMSQTIVINMSNRVDRIRNKYDDFDKLQTEIEILNKDSVEKEFDARDAACSRYDQVIAEAETKINLFTKEKSIENEITNTYNNVKLPTLDLPSFDGNITQWHAFEDSFKALIHDNKTLTDVQKLYYLRSSLTGEALASIKDLSTTSVNYQVAFEIIKNRFSNKRKIIYSHVDTILNIKSLNLRSLINTIDQHMRCLQSLEVPVEKWDAIIVPIVLSKLDTKLIREWELHINSSIQKHSLPSYKQLIEYLLERSSAYSFSSNRQITYQKTPKIVTALAKQRPQTQSCVFCKENHLIYGCKNFLAKTPSERLKWVKETKMCINCLKVGHFIRDCTSQSRCKNCNSNHHSLLHINVDKYSKDNTSSDTLSVNCCTDVSLLKESLLPTVEILIFDKNGCGHKARTLLDSASQSNFVKESFAKKIGLKFEPLNINITGINRGFTNVKYATDVIIGSKTNSFKKTLQTLILPNITDNLPQTTFNRTSLKLPNYVTENLADDSFNISGQIDFLIGASVFWSLLEADRVVVNKSGVAAQKSKLGWIVSGQIPSSISISTPKIRSTFCTNIEKLWILDEFKEPKNLQSEDEKYCENIFNTTTKRDKSGRFIVRIPLKENHNNLGTTKDSAIKRFLSLEKRLDKDINVKSMYVNFMREYERLGHMSIVNDYSINNIDYYLPHHHVIRNESITTKLRVVFDGSFKSSSGLSINDVQHVGPALQTDLFAILISFRQFNFVATADIEKMYRQILIDPSQRNLQKIVWRESPKDKLQSYTLNTVTYGTASAPYLAIRSIHEVANLAKNNFPEEAHLMKNNIYVDDLLIGANSIQKLETHCKNISHLFAKSGFKLHKWASNTKSLSKVNQTNNTINFNSDNTKTLGIKYNPLTDNFNYDFKKINSIDRLTKRKIVSLTSTIFDPLGLLSPVVIIPKIIIQELWKSKLNWDQPAPKHAQDKWHQFVKELHSLKNLSIQRLIINPSYKRVELHGFADASIKAYGACIYLKSILDNKKCQINLVCAKSRVAPLKQISLARLELCAAMLLAELVDRMKTILTISIDKYYLWSDSTIVLAWIRNPSYKWKTFVANRASEIQTITNIKDWRHVKSNENPADMISRGCTLKELQVSSLWWQGPTWLAEELNLNEPPIEMKTIPEQKERITLHATTITFDIFSKYSNFNTLINVVAYMFRFIHNCKNKSQKIISELTINERRQAQLKLIKLCQIQMFNDEIIALQKNKQINKNSKILSLSPHLDKDGLLRVGGRLNNANYSYNKIHQIILPHHRFTTTLLNYYHIINLHCGPLYLLNTIRNMYWPIAGKNLCKKIVHNCIRCYKLHPKSYNQFMGDLPENRITPSAPFLNTGVDYAGPVYTRDRRARGYKKFKSYICLFICLATKAIHLDLVSDLTAEAFLACLRRFISRRGKPKSIYSDNGTNFVAANRKIKEFYTLIKNEASNIVKMLSNEDIPIEWHFIPPRAPHFGGLWESNIKLVKSHLAKVVGENIFTFEELSTLLTQIEAVINSRPISPLSDDPRDLNPLTPAHFLIGRPLTALPTEYFTHTADTRLSAFQRMEKITQMFWKRWKHEYIHTLQTRKKWQTKNLRPIKSGMMVVLKEDLEHPMSWKLARIVELHPGNDNNVRVVTLKTANGLIKRNVTKICILPIEDNI